MSRSVKGEEGRERRLWLRDLGQQVLLRTQEDWTTAERRYAGCGRWRRPDEAVELRMGEDGRAGFGGLQVCGSVWSCPQCGAKVRAHRAAEIDEAARAWMDAGKVLLFVTLTVPHDRGQALGPLFETVVEGFRGLMSGHEWSGRTRQRVRRGLVVDRWREEGLRDRLGYGGLVRSCEVTYGRAGWHPHLHVLLFLDPAAARRNVQDLRGLVDEEWSRQWAEVALRAGLREPHQKHGVDVQIVKSVKELSAYLAKVQDEKGNERGVGNELARADWKEGRRAGLAPFQVLELAALGSKRCEALWEEFRRTTAGRQAITFSAGLRALCGLEAAAEVDDQAIAEAEAAAVESLPLDDLAWRTVCERVGGRHELLRTAEYAYAGAGWPAAVEAVSGLLLALRARWAEDPHRTRWGERWARAG